MSNNITINDFVTQFTGLNEHNQKYIIAIQQALMYAQENEEAKEEKQAQKEY